jgi:signal transduction histidine kinase
LLAFSRQQPQALRVAELNPVINEIVKTLHRLIGEDIELSFISGPGLGRVRLDPVQIEQILLNLAANSRDAMPQGGDSPFKRPMYCSMNNMRTTKRPPFQPDVMPF